ncbi:MAG: ChaN family lipoprotein [Thermoanaerobaculia bacterium]
MKSSFWSVACLVASIGASSIVWAGTKEYHMEIGDPARKAKEVPVVLDVITDARTGDSLSPTELASRLSDKRIVLVGESHINMDFHLAQLRIIEELHRAGKPVVIGLEMYPYTSQEYLDLWVAGMYTEEGFLELSSWYDSWGNHWDYYRDIFLFARDNNLRMYALNTPREVVAAVRKKGLEELTEEEKAHIPTEIDVDNEEHLQLFKTFFEDEGDFHSSMSEEQWRGMFAAQCTWDATFAHNALQVLEEHGDPEAILVVLVGSGHVVYDLGIQRQAAQWSDLPIASVIPIPIRTGDDEPIETVQASYADFVWGLPAETDPLYPVLGVSTRKGKEDDRRSVIYVDDESVGARAGFELGDLILEMDGEPIPDKERLAQLMAGKRWGDTSVVKVQRGEETVAIEVAFRREPPSDEETDGEESQ